MQLDLEGRRFLVTGGSSGIGLAVARSLSAEGARVIVTSRDSAKAEGVASQLGDDALGLPLDLSDEDSLTQLVASVCASEPLDGAVLSTGGPAPGRLMETARADWESAFGSVFMAQVRLLQLLVPNLSRGSAVCLVLSTSVRTPLPTLSISNGLRPGLAMLVNQAAQELGPQGIRVFGIAPGRIETPRTVAVDKGDPKARSESLARIPLGRLGRPDEIGDATAFLMSPRASYITGTTIFVDGGMTRAI